MTNIRGKFIVIEGIDGSGKTTQVKKLVDWLRSSGKSATMVTGPSSGPIGKLIRQKYLSGDRKCDFRTIQALYLADRLDMITNSEDGIISLLNSGINVIADRFYMSSVAYYAQEFIADRDKYEEALSLIYSWNKIYDGLLKPDMTVFLDIRPTAAASRLDTRKKKVEIYDNEMTINRVADTYYDVIQHYGTTERIVMVNANQAPADVLNCIIRVISDLPGWGGLIR